MSRHNLTNISTRDTYGVEWTGQSGMRYRLINRRGTTTLTFGARRGSHDSWNMVEVVNPSRHMRTAPTTHTQFVSIADKFIVD